MEVLVDMDALKKTLMACVKTTQESGLGVRPGGIYDCHIPNCSVHRRGMESRCLLGAVLYANRERDIGLGGRPRAAAILELTIEEAASLEGGFEGWDELEGWPTEFYELGQTIAAELAAQKEVMSTETVP